MPHERVLVVEDDLDVRELIGMHLRQRGYRIEEATSGEDALPVARAFRPDLVLLDRMLPVIDGLEICRQLKADPQLGGIPIVMVTARSEETDIVAGLQAGADDYVTKPFRPRELVARIQSVLRRSGRREAVPNEGILIRELLIAPAQREARVMGERVDLSATEFDVLLSLARHRLQPLSGRHQGAL